MSKTTIRGIPVQPDGTAPKEHDKRKHSGKRTRLNTDRQSLDSPPNVNALKEIHKDLSADRKHLQMKELTTDESSTTVPTKGR